MATPYVMSKVTSCYFPCESDADLPDCCKDVSKACSQRYAAFASWCPVCKEDAGPGGSGAASRRGCCSKVRRRSLSETAEPPATDPLREHNRSYDPWKQPRPSPKGAAAAAYDLHNYQQRPFDGELFEHGDVEENLDHGRMCPTKRLKERLMPFCSLNHDYEPEAVNGGSFRQQDFPPEGRPGPPRCRVEISPQKVLIDGPFSTRRERCSGPAAASCRRRHGSPPGAGDSRSPSPPPLTTTASAPIPPQLQHARCLPAAKRPMAGARSPPPLREPSPQKRGCPEWRGGARPPAPPLPPPSASPPPPSNPGPRLRRSTSRSPEKHSPPPPAARGDYARCYEDEDCCCCDGGGECHVKPPNAKLPYPTKLSPSAAAAAAQRSPSPPSLSAPTHLRHASAPMARHLGASSPPPPPGRRIPPLLPPAPRGSPFAGKSTSALPPCAPPVLVPQRRSLSPPACLTAEHAAAAAAAKAQQHSVHRQQQLARAAAVAAAQQQQQQQQQGNGKQRPPPLGQQLASQPNNTTTQQHHAVSGSGDQSYYNRQPPQPQPLQQQQPVKNSSLQRHIADIEALRSRLRELRGGGTHYGPSAAPSGYGSVATSYSSHATGVPSAAAPTAAGNNLGHPGEGKRQRQRSESDPGHGVPPQSSSPPHYPTNGAHSPSPPPSPPLQTILNVGDRIHGGGGERSHHHHHHHRHHHSHRHRHSQQQSDSREAKRARDASPPPVPLPQLPLPSSQQNSIASATAAFDHHRHRHHHSQRHHQHTPLAPPPPVHRNDSARHHGGGRHHHKKDSSPVRLQKGYPRKRSPLQVIHCHDSSDSDYEDQTADYDSKAVAAEDSEEDSRSIMSSLTTASSSDSVTPSVVGETLGAISLSDVAISITNPPRAPVKPLTPPRPPLAQAHRKGNFPRSLRGSLFSHVPPYIRFSMHDAKGDNLPPELGAVLKWKLSTITPVVVRRTLVNSGFRLVRSECSFTESNEWSGTWGKHMKSLCFRTLKEFQKINHFPGTFQIGRKDRLWKNLYRLMTKFGRKEFGFIPRTYVLPQDSKLLRQAWEKNCGREKWIIKPPASARGAGIKVIHRWAQIPKRRPLVVQKYIADPYLINGSKFDLRLYVLVTSMNPMRVYIYDDGLVRFASVKYSGEMSTLNDRYMHLTNYSINKLSSMYTQNEDATACQGHKWTVKTLWSYMEKLGVDIHRLWDTLVDLCIKTIISGETAISQLTRTNLPSRYCSYELFGIDVLLDENLKPWLLEVNISPSLHSASPLDLAVKGPLVRDLMNLAGYHVPNKLLTSQTDELLATFGVSKERVSSLCFDRRLYTTLLSQEERQKHHLFQSFAERDEYLVDIVDKLTPDDVRHLIQAEDELTQAGRFIRIFPTPDTWIYLEYFESPTYYNRLFDAWESKYHENRQEGIERLELLCRKKHHLMVPPATGSAKFSVNPQALLAEGAVGALGIEGEKKCTEENTLPESCSIVAANSVPALSLPDTAGRIRLLPGPANAAQRPCRRMFASALMGYLGLTDTGLSVEEKQSIADGLKKELKTNEKTGEKVERSGSTRKGNEMKDKLQQKKNEESPKLLTLSSVALYRAARPRSGKPGVVLKPFPRSSYVSRKPRTSTPGAATNANTSASAPTTTTNTTTGHGHNRVGVSVGGGDEDDDNRGVGGGGQGGCGGGGQGHSGGQGDGLPLRPAPAPATTARSPPPQQQQQHLTSVVDATSTISSTTSPPRPPPPPPPRSSCPTAAAAAPSKLLQDLLLPPPTAAAAASLQPQRLRRSPNHHHNDDHDPPAPGPNAASAATRPLAPEGTACPC